MAGGAGAKVTATTACPAQCSAALTGIPKACRDTFPRLNPDWCRAPPPPPPPHPRPRRAALACSYHSAVILSLYQQSVGDPGPSLPNLANMNMKLSLHVGLGGGLGPLLLTHRGAALAMQ